MTNQRGQTVITYTTPEGLPSVYKIKCSDPDAPWPWYGEGYDHFKTYFPSRSAAIERILGVLNVYGCTIDGVQTQEVAA